jgi:hypothetical protein
MHHFCQHNQQGCHKGNQKMRKPASGPGQFFCGVGIVNDIYETGKAIEKKMVNCDTQKPFSISYKSSNGSDGEQVVFCCIAK